MCEKLQATDYMSRGYNVVTGNNQNPGGDDGWKSLLFDTDGTGDFWVPIERSSNHGGPYLVPSLALKFSDAFLIAL